MRAELISPGVLALDDAAGHRQQGHRPHLGPASGNQRGSLSGHGSGIHDICAFTIGDATSLRRSAANGCQCCGNVDQFQALVLFREVPQRLAVTGFGHQDDR